MEFPLPARVRLRLVVTGAVLAPLLAMPQTAFATNSCVGSLAATGFSPIGVAASPVVDVEASFHGEGPGYTDTCDLGWVTTCDLLVDGAPVQATCTTRTATPDRCWPYDCDVDLRSAVVLSPGLHVLEATVGMTWGCCGWWGGPESRSTSTWSVTNVLLVRTDNCLEGEHTLEVHVDGETCVLVG